MLGLERQALAISTVPYGCGIVGQARAISGGEWYESGTGFFIVRYRVRITMSVELAVPIHHRGDGEVAGEGSGI